MGAAPTGRVRGSCLRGLQYEGVVSGGYTATVRGVVSGGYTVTVRGVVSGGCSMGSCLRGLKYGELSPGFIVELSPGFIVELSPGFMVELSPGFIVELSPGVTVTLLQLGSFSRCHGCGALVQPGSWLEMEAVS